MIISLSNFKDMFFLPTNELGNDILSYILRLEPEILEKVLGYSLKKDFLLGLEETPIDTKWLELRDGGEFTFDTKLMSYKGIADIITAYVYYHYIIDKEINFNIGGGYSLAKDAEKKVNTIGKQVTAYNFMVNRIYEMYIFIQARNLENLDNYGNIVYSNFKKKNIFNF